MLSREMIIEGLNARGIAAEPVDVTKNGIVLHGITLGEGNIRPTIYVEQFKEYTEEDLEDAVDEILYQCDKAKEEMPVINPDKLLDWEWARTRLQLCIQPKGNEDIVKQDFLDLEKYVRVRVDDNGSFKVKPGHLKDYGVTEDELFEAAWECTKPTLTVNNMAEIIAEMMGISVEELDRGNGTPQIVISNQSKVFGAVGIYDTETLAEIADKYGKDLVILPSSIHECIVMPMEITTRISELDAMVQEVNETQVEPEEVLSNHAYRFNRNTRKITF